MSRHRKRSNEALVEEDSDIIRTATNDSVGSEASERRFHPLKRISIKYRY